ncbi:MAG: sigma-70 family RNA polymerase sigma factor [Gemmatimonadetes bacterium]|nr:sigma-70 family RNA polymerase sigma factor [Gemmatimonadota bacterium]
MTEPGYSPQKDGSGALPPDAEPTDRDLITRARGGDRAAFGRLLRRHQRRVFALGVRWFRNPDDADDLVQETFVRVWRSLDRFDPERPFVPWLMTIATNRAKTMVERTKSAAEREELDERIPWDGPSPHEDAARAALVRDVNRAMENLPEELRVTLHLRSVEGLAYREIAETLEVPIGTVMSRLARARRRLKERLAEHAGEEERT